MEIVMSAEVGQEQTNVESGLDIVVAKSGAASMVTEVYLLAFAFSHRFADKLKTQEDFEKAVDRMQDKVAKLAGSLDVTGLDPIIRDCNGCGNIICFKGC